MKGCVVLCLVLAFFHCAAAQGRQAFPNNFVIAWHTFFDFGPPNDYYELFFVQSKSEGTSIERITLTPAGDACTQPAKLEIASAHMPEPVVTLLGQANPCTIPEKDLRRELKRCKRCLVFSGANVAMQVQCGTQTRIIRADILDKDMFDSAPNTPPQTSWTMQLLGRIDRAVGPGVMEKPVFPLSSDQPPSNMPDSDTLRDVDAGKYDPLFQGSPDKPSDVYRAAQSRLPAPSVKLVSSTPFQPVVFDLPSYPPLARLAQVQGRVAFEVDAIGRPGPPTFEQAHPLLKGVVENAAKNWKFPNGNADPKVRATIDFALNCPAKGK